MFLLGCVYANKDFWVYTNKGFPRQSVDNNLLWQIQMYFLKGMLLLSELVFPPAAARNIQYFEAGKTQYSFHPKIWLWFLGLFRVLLCRIQGREQWNAIVPVQYCHVQGQWCVREGLCCGGPLSEVNLAPTWLVFHLQVQAHLFLQAFCGESDGVQSPSSVECSFYYFNWLFYDDLHFRFYVGFMYGKLQLKNAAGKQEIMKEVSHIPFELSIVDRDKVMLESEQSCACLQQKCWKKQRHTVHTCVDMLCPWHFPVRLPGVTVKTGQSPK